MIVDVVVKVFEIDNPVRGSWPKVGEESCRRLKQNLESAFGESIYYERGSRCKKEEWVYVR
jgi:hypothetical protein